MHASEYDVQDARKCVFGGQRLLLSALFGRRLLTRVVLRSERRHLRRGRGLLRRHLHESRRRDERHLRAAARRSRELHAGRRNHLQRRRHHRRRIRRQRRRASGVRRVLLQPLVRSVWPHRRVDLPAGERLSRRR